MLNEFEIVIRLIASVIIGLLIGLSRRRKPAGIRTFALISLGSAIFTLVSIADMFSLAAPNTFDPTRIIAQIVAGVGFLGLGVIWRNGINKPAGLTTAAAIWVTASVGVLAGLGMWIETIVGTILILAILYSKEPLMKAHIED
ncbi:MgtC family protein [Candidatus Bilamarchaeum dharawalense]|uniref:MgtC family protein n=1 Tax=Candidatus Bilamarchaeum dharawalense TaxID=2885759 RepID=A0A5E4LRF2_9ARCH|nr:MgtC family protein [Candidatus Bilamarchaeum dharawalense]